MNIDKLKEKLNSINWSIVFKSEDVDNECFNSVKNIYTCKTKDNPLKSWINVNLVCRIEKRNTLYKKTKLHANNINIKNVM